MPDITMCKGTGAAAFPLSAEVGAPPPQDCPIREQCYRFMATPSGERQSWFVGIPWGGDSCEHYWCLRGHEELSGKAWTASKDRAGETT